MRLIFLGVVLLCVSSAVSITVTKGKSTEENDLADDSTKNVTVCIVCVSVADDQSDEEEEANPSETNTNDHETSNSEKKQKWKKKWQLRREKNRFADHHHHHQHHQHRWTQKVRRLHERKNRWNEKKKFFKKIQFSDRSSRTDQLNDAMDKILAHFTETLSSGNSTFTLRLDKPHVDMKIVPWTFVNVTTVELEKTYQSNMTNEIMTGSKNATKEEKAEVDVDENEDDGNTENDSKQVPTNAEDEPHTSAETDVVKEEANKVAEDDDDDDDDDEDEAISETSANVTCLTNNSTRRYYLTSKPSPAVLSDGAVEYYLKLLSEEEIQCSNRSTTEPTELENEGHEPKMSKKRQRAYAKRYSRRSFARVEGTELIERNGDVMIGSRENSSIQIVDVQLRVGPLTFIMDKKVAYPFRKSRVAFPPLMTRLRLKISEGQLLSARFKPKKIKPSEAIVSLQLKENEALISTEQVIGRFVGYLSQETTSAWNSGYLLRRLKGKFKQLYIGKTVSKKIEFNNENARKLVELLTAYSVSSTSDQQQPSTEHPSTTDIPIPNELDQIEILPVISTSMPITQ